MSRRAVIAALLTVLGVLITLVGLRDGLHLSFTILLGLLLIADGIIRFALISQERTKPSDPI
jgi:uncharacterized membrane protein HdeD (DUF308 family)